MKFLKGFLINLQFFTAIPIKSALPMDKEHLNSSIKSFPLVGLFQGLIYISFLYLLVQWTPLTPLAIAFVIWLLTIIVTGGIHLDGWMDASDAYFSYQDKEKRLDIMKDPRTGAFGVLSVIVLLSCRFLFIYEITISLTAASYLLILSIPLISKTVMGLVLITVPSAKKDGLAALFQSAAGPRSLSIYPFYAAGMAVVCFVLFREALYPFMILILAGFGCFLLIRRKAIKWYGGITGDVLGASVEGTEVLLWMILWLLHYSAMV
ncbi:adenosylcobinamide-GDP ribazoletransferase [Bacillus dakarensis]|uniref:adenosylcobinamide-GDP ribazoletransferase n=1 Tax=Robertmurraya dakarensis TaxID=1926278 RepID=UPI000981971A|nr:adenosylcobinamide-GDP ribazoletransferase [Bacillus dakarensis]